MNHTSIKSMLLAALLFCAALASAQNISTIAGGGSAVGDSVPALTGYIVPYGLATDAANNLYIADYTNSVVRKVDAITGIMKTIAGNDTAGYSGDGGLATHAQLAYPTGVAVDVAGNVYIADGDNYRVRKVNTSGIITTIAGTGVAGYNGDVIAATTAQVAAYAIAIDHSGNVIIADGSNNRVRKISGGIITTIAGNGTPGDTGDGGAATAAEINFPNTVAVGPAGDIYFSDHGNFIRKISASGIITTIAGDGTGGSAGDGGPAMIAEAFTYDGLFVDDTGNVYFSCIGGVRKINTAGIVNKFAGSYGFGGYGGDGGPATLAYFYGPFGVTMDHHGNLYAADQNNVVRKVNTAGIISTYAGNHLPAFTGDGLPAKQAYMQPLSLAWDTSGNLVFSDYHFGTIRKLMPDGTVQCIAGNGLIDYTGDGGPATSASMSFGCTITIDRLNNIYITDNHYNCLRKITTGGIINTIAGSISGTAGYGGDGGLATYAIFSRPLGTVVDTSGNVYICDGYNYRVRKINSSGIISTIAGTGVAGFSGDGGPALSAKFTLVFGLAVDKRGNMYVADLYRIRKIDAMGIISTIAGTGVDGYTGDNGPATAAKIGEAQYLRIDDTGNLFMSQGLHNVVRKIDTFGIITTVAGNGVAGFSGDGGPATNAKLSGNSSIFFDASGNMYIADTDNDRIRFVCKSDSIVSSAVISSGGVTTIYSGTSVTFTSAVNNMPASTYQWEKNGVPISGATNATYTTTTLTNGNIISCVVTSGDPLPCATSATATSNSITMVVNPLPTVVSQLSAGANGIEIFPNPTKGSFVIKGTFERCNVATIEIVNLLGNVVFKKENIAMDNGNLDTQIDLPTQLQSGIYLLRVHTSSSTNNFRFVLEK